MKILMDLNNITNLTNSTIYFVTIGRYYPMDVYHKVKNHIIIYSTA